METGFLNMIFNEIILPLKYNFELLYQIFDLFILSILIILLGMIIGKIIYLVVFGLLRIIYFDTLLDFLGIYKFIDAHLRDIPSRLVARLFYWLTLLLFISIAVNRTGVDMVKEISDFIRIIPSVFAFLTILFFSAFIGFIIGKTLQIVFSVAGFFHLKLLPEFIAFIFFLIALPYSLEIINVSITTTYSIIILMFQTIIIVFFLTLAYSSISCFKNIYAYLCIIKKFTIGDNVLFEEKEMKISKINVNTVELYYDKGKIYIESRKFLKSNINKLNY
jgi:hypothetical protein